MNSILKFFGLSSLFFLFASTFPICVCGAQMPEPFFPANEYYLYYSELGIVAGYAGTRGSSTNAAIYVTGQTVVSGTLQMPAKYTFAEWASECTEYLEGAGITGSGTIFGKSFWTDASHAFGQATAGDAMSVLVLGDGGSVTMSFARPIVDAEGYDFAVFENALNDTFLEFAFVEVSSDGMHFVRFPNFYLGASPVGGDSTEGGGSNDATLAYNLGCKYKIGYGNGYDLAEFRQVAEYVSRHYDASAKTCDSTSIFTASYCADFLANYSYINLDNIKYVRIVDIVGDGKTLDSSGSPIYDAYPTIGTPGFDLSGIGVINASSTPTYSAWAALSMPSLDAAQRAPAASPYSDGISNIEKYAFGLSADCATTYSENGYFYIVTEKGANGGESLAASFTYRVRSPLVEAEVSVEWSADLRVWSAAGVSQATLSEEGGFAVIKATKSVPEGGKIFFRLKISSRL